MGVEVSGGIHTYKPSEDTILLASNIPDIFGDHDIVLDVGTGSGILAILTARHGSYVVGIDISYESLLDAYKNIIVNNVDQYIDLIQGDTLECIRNNLERPVIISNPPYLPGLHEFVDDHIYIGGPHGIDVALKILSWLAKSRCGEAYILLSSYSREDLFRYVLTEYGCKYVVLDEIVLDGEKIMLYKIWF